MANQFRNLNRKIGVWCLPEDLKRFKMICKHTEENLSSLVRRLLNQEYNRIFFCNNEKRVDNK